MHSIKISVIIASLNCGRVIEQAICSFIDQKYADKELIIIDGGSTDNTLSIINRFRRHIAVFVSEEDNGVYDAYNKGVSRATGDYVVFLGADDSFYNKNTLSRIAGLIEDNDHPDLLSTSVMCIESGWAYVEKKRIPVVLKEGIKRKDPMIPHQGLYTRKEILKEHPFRTEYRICADLEFYLYCCMSKKNIVYSDPVSAYYSCQGISSLDKKKRGAEGERILLNYGFKLTNVKDRSELRNRFRQCVFDNKAGMVLLLRLRDYKIHRCRNAHCRWCEYNQRRIKTDRRS